MPRSLEITGTICNAIMNQVLFFSLLSLGFFGGFSHCTFMCGPFVVTQVSRRLENTSLESFYGLVRLKNFALIPYHLGRITTYSAIGFCCAFLNSNLQDIIGFRIFSALFLLIGAIIFLKIFLERDQKLFFSNILRPVLQKISNFQLPFKSKTLKISTLISALFKNPQGLNGYLLGILLGFLPCGLLFSAFLIASTFQNPLIAAFGMFLFGIATFPALFIAGHGASLIKIAQLKYVTKIIALINAIMLFLMAIKLIF